MASREKASERKTTSPKLKAIEPADDDGDELVTCFMSGKVVPKREAVLVPLGPGRRAWMLPEFLSERER